MEIQIVTMGLITAVIVAISIYATMIAIKDDHYSKAQRWIVIALCWLLPIIGATITIAAYRSNNPLPLKKSKNDDINLRNRHYVFIPGSSNDEGGGSSGSGGGDGD